MSNRIDLVWLSEEPAPGWLLGDVHSCPADVVGVERLIATHLDRSLAAAWLFWDGSLGPPPPCTLLQDLVTRPGDVWHAGLALGTSGLPGLLDFIAPTWMLNRDPDPRIEATSWRLSLRACLLRVDVLRQMGGVHPGFKSLTAGALEMGHRWITRGVLMRHVPALCPQRSRSETAVAPLDDEIRFCIHRFGRRWTRWAVLQAVASGYAQASTLLGAWVSARPTRQPGRQPLYTRRVDGAPPLPPRAATVSVVVPTVHRYPYLRVLLGQMRQQVVAPHEILIVDQTPLEDRDQTIVQEFADLPLRVVYLEQAGQCSSRNAALGMVQGDFVLFIDDDDEVPPTLIATHLRTLRRYNADVSAGIAHEVGAGQVPDGFRFARASDVFPTNNSLVRTDALRRSGLFDLAYDRGDRADGDLGMRLYLSGAVMVLDPENAVVHHHAPRGGLRTHNARVVTYASSRSRLSHRRVPSATELYCAMRYFSIRQVRQFARISVLGTFSLRGGPLRRVAKGIVAAVCLPRTLWEIRSRVAQARRLLATYPRIPQLASVEMERQSG